MSSKSKPVLLCIVTEDFAFERGHPLPLGATIERGGINFAIFSRHATSVTLVLFRCGIVCRARCVATGPES